MINKNTRIAILGTGNIGSSIANGLVKSETFSPEDICLTRKNINLLIPYTERGFVTNRSNPESVSQSEIIIIAVTPQQLNDLMEEIRDSILENHHTVISIVSGVSIKQLKTLIGKNVPVIRAMPNTAISILESMTCICGSNEDTTALNQTKHIFDSLGKTVIIAEDLMVPATALCACGIAFFLRAIRAASQGGIEIGFHAEDALFMASQTAKGAAAILLEAKNHPEREVDKVTTPQGCTISGLNQMEHHGFSSSLIRGIVTSAEKAEHLYSNKD